MIGNTLRLYERAAPGVLFNDMNACNNYSSGLARASEVQCPALMILGAEDRLTPIRGTQPLQDALREVEVVLLPGAGHTITVEAPNALLEALHKVL
jgi:pimeloyl-ACP methyl ester carboxylesterase